MARRLLGHGRFPGDARTSGVPDKDRKIKAKGWDGFGLDRKRSGGVFNLGGKDLQLG